MERARHGRSKSASGGIHQFQKHKAVTRFSPEYRSYIDGSTRNDDDMFTLELGQRSLRRASARPVEKLLEEEMSKEAELKRRTSTIARLVGLKGLSSTGHHRQQKRLSDSCQQKTISISSQPYMPTYDGRSNRRSSMEDQKSRDVYKDVEASHIVDRRCSSRWSAKYFSSNEQLQGSIDLDDSSGHYIAVLKAPDSAKYEGNSKAWKSDRHTSNKDITPHVEREDGLLLERHSHYRARVSNQFSKIQLEEKKEKKVLPRRIVVLKPHLGNIQNDGISDPSPDYSHGYGSQFRELEETVSWRRKDSFCDVGFSKPASKDAREIARKITRRMRGGFDETVDAKSSAFRGYAGDESSYEARESDFDSEIEMLKLSSRNSFCDDDNKWRRKNPSFTLTEWSLKVAKERLSERWKITGGYQDSEIVGKGRTLGEMLAIPDKEIRVERLNATRNDPLGISSRDGWKDEINKTSSRSRSLPPRGSHRRGTHHEAALSEENHVMRSEPIRLGRVKIAKRNRIHKEVFSSQDSKSRIRRPLPGDHIHSNEIESSSDANFEIEMEANVKELSHQMIGMDAKDKTYASTVSELTTFSPKASHMVPKQPPSVVDNGKAAARDQKDSILQEVQGSSGFQYRLAEMYTSESSKEADYTSPVSVFEAPFTEDTSSCSESFERVNAELHGVEAWEISYALDVLIESGLQDSGFGMFITKWHCPDCPLDPKLFNNLEKNYSDENTVLRPGRRLIFDRINSALVEIFRQNVDFCPWVMPKLAGFSRQKERVIEGLENLINRVFANVEITERVLDREILWSDYKGEIEKIGNAIEVLLIDGMINEFIG